MASELSEAPTLYQEAANGGVRSAISGIRDGKGKRARESGKIQVFLSHKHKDFEAADQMQKVFRRHSAGRISTFMSENIVKGDDWQEKIENALYKSDWFVLLFSGVDEDWAWCHHEAGIFRGMTYPEADRIVVFYPPNVGLPDPLKKYQGVRCQSATTDQPDDLDLFFKNMFGKPPYPGIDPINQDFAYEDDEARLSACETIIRAVGRLVVRTIEPHTRLSVRVPDISQLESSGFPIRSRVLRGSSALRLFDVGDGEFTWPEFHAALDDRAEIQRRLDELFWPVVCEACWSSAKRKRLMSIHTILRAPSDDRNYHPVLSRIAISGDDSAIFDIDFVQVAVSNQTDVRDQRVARIFTALNLAHRFRWEIIDPYHDVDSLQEFIDRHAGRTGGERSGERRASSDGLAKIWEAIRMIEIEAENRGVSDPDALPTDFGHSARERVSAMFPLWDHKRQELEQAQSCGDVVTFARVLTELDPINVDFISMASQRLGELVRADADHSQT